MSRTYLAAPITTTNRDDGKLCGNNGSTNSGGDFLRTFHTQTNVTIVVSDSDESLETSTLTGTSLLLNGSDLQDLILESTQQSVNDLGLLNERIRAKINYKKR